MKWILAAFAAFFSPVAFAQQYMVLQFNEHVRIVIADKKCDGGLVAVAQRIDNQYLRGCAKFEEGNVIIQWEGKGADSSTFPLVRFYPVETK